MNSNNYISSFGFSLGSILNSFRVRWFLQNDSAVNSNLINFPDEITVVTDNESFALNSSDKSKWNFKNVNINLKEKNNAIAIEVQSPDENLKYVTLKWNIEHKLTNRYIGDHWERSYADLHWGNINSSRIMPWYFMEYDGKVTNGFGVKTGCNTMCSWQVNEHCLKLILDTRSGGKGVILGDRVLHAAEIITMIGKEEDSSYKSTHKFCKLMCDSPRYPKQPFYGIDDWYFAYGKNSSDLILEHASLIADLATNNSNRPFCMIDACWAEEAPDVPRDCWADSFYRPNSYFMDMAVMAEKIREFGMRPGLWVRPLCASYKDKENLLLPKIPGRENPKEPILDPTIPENMERIRNYFLLFKKWKYDIVKHDFITFDMFGKWGFQMFETGNYATDGWSFYNKNLTNAEITLNLFKEIRDAVGDMYVLSCNTFSHLSAGLFEINRIGDDTSGKEWDRTKRMGVNALGHRIVQNKAFYAADGDCVGLTPNVPWEKNKQWMQLVAESGTPLLISVQKEALGSEQKAFIKQCFSIASQDLPTGEPLDWMENQFPEKWLLNGKEVKFCW